MGHPVYHTAEIEKIDPSQQIQEHLLQFRATPHPTTDKPPAELLFGRKFKTRLPDLRVNIAKDREDVREAREADKQAKLTMKKYKDGTRTVKPTLIKPGDQVLLKRKTSKHLSVYEPEPYTVVNVFGSQIEAEREGVLKCRDAQRWKLVDIKPAKRFQIPDSRKEAPGGYSSDPDIGAGAQQQLVITDAGPATAQREVRTAAPPPNAGTRPARPVRDRRQPDRLCYT